MQGLVLAGGFGTRLRPLTAFLPKPMVPIADVPAMEHVVRLLVKAGITDQIALLYFQPEAIRRHFGDGTKFGARMSYCTARDDLGTAGSVGLVRNDLTERFLIISSDIVTNFDLKQAIAFHEERKALATIVLTRVPNPLQYGVVITGKDGRIERFLEKPSWGEVFSDSVNTGIYIFEPEIFDWIPENENFDFSKHLFPRLLEEGERLFGYVADGYWRDVGTIEEYRRAHQDYFAGLYDLDLRYLTEERDGAVLSVGDGARIDPSARFAGRVVVGPGARIAPGARIEDAVVGKGAVVEEDAKVRRSILWNDVEVGRGAELDENVVASGARVGRGAVLGPGAVISQEARIGDEARVRAGVKVWPRKYVEEGATLAHSLVWADRWASTLFGSHGITGLASLEITPEFAAQLGAAYGAFLGKGGEVFAARDEHRASRMISRALGAGLISAGVRIRDIQALPLPVLRYNVRAHDVQGGFYCRLSPYETGRSDIKILDLDGLDLPVRKEKAVENLFYREDFARARPEETGEITYPVRGLENYREGFLSALDLEAIRTSRFKLVLDYSGGGAIRCLPAILSALEVEVIALHAHPDESLLLRTPEFFEERLARAAEIVRGTSSHLGIVLSPGGERMRIIDDTGAVTTVEEEFHLMLHLALHAGGVKKIGVPVVASRRVEALAKEANAEVVRTRTSNRSMMEAAGKGEADFIGEMNGGFIFSDFLPAFDGMFAAARLLEYLAKIGEPLSEVRRRVPDVAVVHQTVRCAWHKKGEVMRRLVEEASASGESEAVPEGVRFVRNGISILALPDPDRPLFHLYAEGEDASAADAARAAANALAERIWEWHR